MGFSVGEAAKRIGGRPNDVSRLFYQGVLDERFAPMIAGRRVVDPTYLPVIQRVLRERGLLQEVARESWLVVS